MNLIDLNPQFMDAGGEHVSRKNPNTGEYEPVLERHGIGIMFDCPCGCDSQCYVDFRNPLDGGPMHQKESHSWQREGDTFETLSLTPSILRISHCGWHGYITKGKIITV